MRHSLAYLGLALLVFSGAACSSVSWTMRAGTAYPPKPAPCELTFATQDLLQPWNMEKYQLLGTMAVEHFQGSWNAALKKSVAEKACAVGADLAAINMVVVNPFNGVQTANIVVYRRRFDDSAPRNAAASAPIKNI